MIRRNRQAGSIEEDLVGFRIVCWVLIMWLLTDWLGELVARGIELGITH